VYFEVLEMLLRAGVTLVAEAAFQDRIWRPRLEPFAEFADIRVVRCSVDADTADQRIVRRMEQNSLRAAHADTELLQARANGVHLASGFGWITLDVPNLEVDTSDGYRPGLEEIVEFANRPGG
jgi:predicted kinase